MNKKIISLIVLFFTIFFSYGVYEISQAKPATPYVAATDIVLTETELNNSNLNLNKMVNSTSNSKFKLKTLIVKGQFDSSEYTNVTKLNKNTTILKFETEEETEIAYNKLSNQPEIKVFIDQIEEVSAANTDYHFYDDWGYDKIDINPYMNYLTSNISDDKEAVVVVIDSGINTSHKYLKDRILRDASGNYVGYAATNVGVKVTTTYTYSGYEFEDDRGHGTHVAGIICNSTPSNVKILPIKLMGPGETFSINGYDIEDIFYQIAEYSKTYNIVCVNMSFGGYWTSGLPEFFEDCIDEYLIPNNILPIASAGNDGKNADEHYPSALDNVVCVSALTESSPYATLASYSNYGSTVDISAPGTSVLSCYINGTNGSNSTAAAYLSGTSMATPYVCGVVALLSLDPNNTEDFDIESLKTKLYYNVIDLGNSGLDDKYGYGMTNLTSILGNISYTANNKTVTYNGNYHNISITNVSVANYSLSYRHECDTEFSNSITNNVNFKNYSNGAKKVYFKITATGYTDTIGFAYLTINKADIGINVSNQTSVYGNIISFNNSEYSTSYGTIYGSDDLEVKLSTSATSTSSIGNYPINATINNSNYNLYSCSLGTLTITERPLSVTIENKTCTYGNVNLDDIIYSVDNIANNDNLSISFTTNANNKSNVGSDYTIWASCSNANYSLNSTASLTIIKRNLTISSEQNVTYGEIMLNNNNYKIVEGSKAFANDEFNIKFSTNASESSNIGNYELYFTYNNNNYNISLKSSTSKVIVKPRTIKLKINPSESVYGDPININKSYEIISGSLVNNDHLTLNFSTNATSTSNVGTYFVTCENVSQNYSVGLLNNTYTITKRPITIKLKNQTSPHGLMFEIDQDKFEIVLGSVVDNTDLGLVINSKAKASSFFGKYDLTAYCNNGNYEVEIIDAKITLIPSFEDATIVLSTIIVFIIILVKFIKVKKAKNKNKELFNKYIGW